MNMLFSCINNNSFSFHYYRVIVSFLLLRLVICLYVSKLMMNTDVVVSFRGKRKAGLFWDGLNLFMRIESGVKNKKTSHTRYLTRFLTGFLSGTYNLLFYIPTGFDIMTLPIDK